MHSLRETQAKDGRFETLLSDPTAGIDCTMEPTYEEVVEGHSSKRTRTEERINYLKVKWQNRCKTIEGIGILCRGKPWDICNQKLTLSLQPKSMRALASTEESILLI